MTLKHLMKVISAGPFRLYSFGVRAEEAPADVPTLMKYLEQQMIEVNRSLIWDDFTGLHVEARAIAQHPVLPVGERAKVLSRLASDATPFRAHDARKQEAAQGLADAAPENDRPAVEKCHWTLIERCAECHREFGARLSDGRRSHGNSRRDGAE